MGVVRKDVRFRQIEFRSAVALVDYKTFFEFDHSPILDWTSEEFFRFEIAESKIDKAAGRADGGHLRRDPLLPAPLQKAPR